MEKSVTVMGTGRNGLAQWQVSDPLHQRDPALVHFNNPLHYLYTQGMTPPHIYTTHVL